MLIYVEGKTFVGRTFTLVCEPGFSVGRVKALILHLLHNIGQAELTFRLRFAGSFLREPLTLQDYSIQEMSVLQMVPVSFGRCARSQTAMGPRPFTATGDTLGGQPERGRGRSFGAYTLTALKKEVAVFKRRELMLEVLKALLWLQLAFAVGNFVTIYWWSGLWTGVLVLLSLYFLPTFVHVGGSVGKMGNRDLHLMVVYASCALAVGIGDVVMFLYILSSLVLPHCSPSSPYHNPDTTFGCGYPVWFALLFFPLQTLLLAAIAILSLMLRFNFPFQAGVLIEPTLTQSRDINELLEIAQTGRARDRRQVAFELNNIALLGEESKRQIAAAGGLQVLISLATREDEVTQEYATEALAELLTVPAIQTDFVSQGGVSTLSALVRSPNDYIVLEATYALSYITAECQGNRMALVEENGLDDLLQAYSRNIPEVHLTVGRIFLDLASCGEANPHLISHSQLLDALGERVGGGEGEGRLLALLSLEQLARREPLVVLKRPQIIPHLLDSASCDPSVQLSVTKLLLVFTEDPQDSKQLLSYSKFLSSLRDMVTMTTATINPELSLLLVHIIDNLMRQTPSRAKLISLGVRGFLRDLQTHCSQFPDVQALIDGCLQLLN